MQHASCVDVDGKGVLIVGASGSGKSSLALACISLGAVLVGDDYVDLSLEAEGIIANSPPNISGLIEVPKVGILNCDHIDRTKLALVVDLSVEEAERFPPHRHITLRNREIPLIYGANIPYLHTVVFQFLKAGRAHV